MVVYPALSGDLPPVALLAGGLATRMHPVTRTIAKSMIEVADEPFLAHQMRCLRRLGVGRMVICAGFLSHQIKAFAGDGRGFGLDISYSLDGPRLLGTGGALKRALPLLGPRFFIMYGDSYIQPPMAEIAARFDDAARGGTEGLMTVFANEGRWDTSNIEFRDGTIHRYDKQNRTPAMKHIDWGLGMLEARALDRWPEDEPFDLAQVYGTLLDQGKLMAVEVFDRFYEIGSPEGLAETDRLLRARRLAKP